VIGSGSAHALSHLEHPDWALGGWNIRPECGVAYLGAWSIVEALSAGADIVVCGRVTDTSPVMGAAAWWHGWDRRAFNELAGALVAGRK
jgi:hypothetical protein